MNDNIMTTFSRKEQFIFHVMSANPQIWLETAEQYADRTLRIANSLMAMLDAEQKKDEPVLGDAGFSRVTLEKDLSEYRTWLNDCQAALKKEQQAHAETINQVNAGLDNLREEKFAHAQTAEKLNKVQERIEKMVEIARNCNAVDSGHIFRTLKP